jgi:hypothetical protein
MGGQGNFSSYSGGGVALGSGVIGGGGGGIPIGDDDTYNTTAIG